MDPRLTAPTAPVLDRPNGLFAGVLVWLGLLFVAWLVAALLILISVTPDDAPMHWITAATFPPAFGIAGVLAVVGFTRNHRALLVGAPALAILPVAAVYAVIVLVNPT